MKKHIFILLFFFCLLFCPKNVFAKTGMELSSSNGTVLYSADTTSVRNVNVSNVKYIIFYFEIDTTAKSNYTLNNDFTYITEGVVGNGVNLDYLVLNSQNSQFSNSWTSLIQRSDVIGGISYFTHRYINHIEFTTQGGGRTQVQLTYSLSRATFVRACGIYSSELVFRGSNDVDNTGAINNATTNIITNNNNNTNSIINNQNQNQEQTNEKLDKIDSTLNDDTPPSSDISSLGNVQGLLPPGPVDSVLNIPFKFLSIIVSSLGDLCIPLSGPFVFGSTLTLPCFSDSFYTYVPDELMIFINLIPSAFILINYFKHLYKKVERATSMNSNSDDEWGVL